MHRRRVVLGRYELLRRLDDGGTAETYFGALRGPNGFVKPAVIRAAHRTMSSTVLGAASRAATLSHPGIAHVLDAAVDGDTCFVATEYVPGTTLASVLRREPRIGWVTLARIAADLAAALAYAHGRRRDTGELELLVHGRITPARVALGPSGRAKLTGFGTGWAWPNESRYRAPEERRGERIDGRADVFALGATFAQALPVSAMRGPLAPIVERCTTPWPESRMTAAELRDALCRALVEEGVAPSRPPPPMGRHSHTYARFGRRDGLAESLLDEAHAMRCWR